MRFYAFGEARHTYIVSFLHMWGEVRGITERNFFCGVTKIAPRYAERPISCSLYRRRRYTYREKLIYANK